MRVSGIYSIIHKYSGRAYIGSAVNLMVRIRNHRRALKRNRHPNKHLQHAWNLYGREAFEFAIEEVVKDTTKLIIREQVWIDTMKSATLKHGFNVCPTAGSRLGSKQPKPFAKRMRAVHTGVPKTKEHRRKIGKGNRGKIRSEEVKQRIATTVSERYKESPWDVSGLEAWHGWNKGMKGVSAETSAKMSAAKVGFVPWNKGKKGLQIGVAYWKGKKLSKAVRAKMSASQIARRNRESTGFAEG
jgi:group I intron endonuclease